MADVTGTFNADFAPFASAVKEAQVTLKTFTDGADTAQAKLTALENSFSGVKIQQTATLMVEAVTRLGGATTLTANEQARLNASLTEAIAKYKAIGVAVPPDLQKMADATQAAATSTTSWSASLESLAVSAAAAFSVQRLTAYVGALIDGASALNTLSAQTHINVEDLQVLTAATSSYGVSSEELGRALFNLQNRIAGGDQSVVSAYAAMGIKLDDIKGKNAYDLFVETERGLATLAGGIRDAAAADLYGGKLGGSMAAFSTGVDKAIDDAKRLNSITSGESVQAMAEYGDAINRTKKSIDALVTEGLGKLAQGFNTLNTAANNGAGWGKTLLAWAEDMVGGYGNLTRVIDDQNKKTEANTAATQANTNAQGANKTALDERGRAALFMATMEANAVAPLLDYQKTYLEQLAAMGQLNAANAARIGVTVSQLELYKKGLDAAKQAASDLAKAQADADKIALDQYNKRIKGLEAVTQATLKAYSFDGQVAQLQSLIAAEEATARSVYAQITSEKDRMKVIEDNALRRQTIADQIAKIETDHAKVVNDQVIAELAARAEIEASYGRNVDGTIKVIDAAKDLQVALDNLHAKKQAGIDQSAQEEVLMRQYVAALNGETSATNEAAKAADEWNQSLDKLWKQAGTTFATIGDSIKPVNGGVDALSRSVADLHGQFTALATDTTIPAFFGAMTGYASVASTVMAGGTHTAGEAAYIAAGGIISGSIGGGILHRASGGPVVAGTPYMVGEQGPETFVPKISGTILPAGATGSGVIVNNVFNITDTESAIARRVADTITRSVMRSTRMS